jgi:hypothetical protein|tara:strand:- start:2327 stop:2428 length:102 start_codon:yes stop_codon:yes gene_type:complete
MPAASDGTPAEAAVTVGSLIDVSSNTEAGVDVR